MLQTGIGGIIWLVLSVVGRYQALQSRLAQLQTAVNQAAAMERAPPREDCSICYAAEATVFCRPCKHLAMCQACAARMRPKHCPVCRTKADRTSSVFRP